MAELDVKLGAERRPPAEADAAKPAAPEKFEADLAVPVEKPKRERKRDGGGDGPA